MRRIIMHTILIVAIALGGVLLLKRHASAASLGLPRAYTKADGPNLRALLLTKNDLGRSFRVCMANEMSRRPSATEVWVGTLAGAAGLAVGAVTLDPSKGVKTFRGIIEGYKSARTKDTPCQKEFAELERSMANHDRLCAVLGFPPDVSYETVQLAYGTIGGETFDDVTSRTYAPAGSDGRVITQGFSIADLDEWDKSVRRIGLAATISNRNKYNAGRGIPTYDPNSRPPGLAVRS